MDEFDGELLEIRYRPDGTIERMRVADEHQNAFVIWFDPPPPVPEPDWHGPPHQWTYQPLERSRPWVRIERA